MALAAAFIFLLWLLPAPPAWAAAALLMGAGFFICGPQALIGISAANLAAKEAAADATGFTGKPPAIVLGNFGELASMLQPP